VWPAFQKNAFQNLEVNGVKGFQVDSSVPPVTTNNQTTMYHHHHQHGHP